MSAPAHRMARAFAPGAIEGPHRHPRRTLARRWAVRVLLLWAVVGTVAFVAGRLS